MLKIDIHHETESTSFMVEGKLRRPWVIELEKCWQNEISAEPTRSIVVNLVAVTFIDSEGRELLTRMRRQGAVLVPTGCLMKAMVEEIEAQVREGKHGSNTGEQE